MKTSRSTNLWTIGALLLAFTISSVQTADAETRLILHRGNVAEPDTLDPHKMTTVYENSIGRDLFRSLVTRNAEGDIVPGQAERWDVSEDGLTYTFYLRENSKWSDGHPLTAQDFVAGFQRVFDPKVGSQAAPILFMIANGEEVVFGKLPLDELGVKALDDMTVQIKLRYPSPTFLEIINGPRGSALPRHVFAEHGNRWVKPGNMVSNGAYSLVSWRPNANIRLQKNEHFFDAHTVELDEIVFYPTEDYSAAVKRFRAGELDLNTQIPTQQVRLLKKILPESTRITPALSVTYIIMNQKEAPFDDVRVREALSISIDRELIANKVMQMGEVPAYRLTPYAVSNYDGPEFPFKDMTMDERRQRARELLTEAGFGPDNPLKFEYRIRASADGKRHAVAIQSMWKAVGVQPQILGTEIKSHYADLGEHNFQVADAGWSSLNAPEDFLYLAQTEAGEQNYGQYHSEEFDAAVFAARNIADIVERNKKMAEAEAILLRDHGMIPLYFGTNRNLVAEYMNGYHDNTSNTHDSYYMEIVQDLGNVPGAAN